MLENIALSTKLSDLDMDQLKRAIADSGLSHLVERYGVSGRIENISSVLSGGEKQRIGFARLLFLDCDILLLDEPTANLDRDAEIQFLKLLKGQSRSRTIILVSHSKQAIEYADNILELEGLKNEK
jgi:ATPase subunit of ABC transporter with duplicated ATPase domains